MYKKILIANRGEIAVRIIRACKEMGIHTVAIYSEVDADSLHVLLSDESYCIGPAKISNSYLNMMAIITVAIGCGADAIHPGYGLLSENAKFAYLCEACNIAFIGPTSKIISLMGDKNKARATASQLGVPIIPGTDIITSNNDIFKLAGDLGYPLAIKARSGGGGKGIRIIYHPEELEHGYITSTIEASNTFNDGACYMEKYLTNVKHIEVQILCDSYGNVLCLGERDCSIQRKNQKIIEESPSLAISTILRRQLYDYCNMIAKVTKYVGVGTIEFLYDLKDNVYFMEMNTRLQVEHPITEMVTGIDLVKWQIRVASGIALDLTQKDIILSGHSIECRINAENPCKDFRPSSGHISLYHCLGGPGIRFDTSIYQDYNIHPYYDSMIGKLIVHGSTREEAIRKMKVALCELIIEGIEHNIPLHLKLLSDEAFKNGFYTTSSDYIGHIIKQLIEEDEVLV